MDLDYQAQRRLAREMCDIILDQGGDWQAVPAVLEERYDGDTLEYAVEIATGLMFAYRAPGGPAFLRGMRDALPEPEPARPRKRRWRVA